jgi:hypothetical protein
MTMNQTADAANDNTPVAGIAALLGVLDLYGQVGARAALLGKSVALAGAALDAIENFKDALHDMRARWGAAANQTLA